MAGLGQKFGLLRGLTDGETARVGPFYVTVDITRQCNRHCPGCRFHSLENATPVVGDGTVAHMPWTLFSDLCDELRKVTLWTGSREEYAKYYPGIDVAEFDALIGALKLVKRLKEEQRSKFPKVKLHQPIERGNFRHVELLFEIARATGCEVLSFSPFVTQKHMFASHVLTPAEEREVLGRLERLKKACETLKMAHTINTALLRYRVGGAVWEAVPCYIGWLHARIKPDGGVLPCTSHEHPLREPASEHLRGDLEWAGIPDIPPVRGGTGRPRKNGCETGLFFLLPLKQASGRPWRVSICREAI